MLNILKKHLNAASLIIAISSGSYFIGKVCISVKNIPLSPVIISELAVNTVQRGIRGSTKLISESITKVAVKHNLERSALSCILYIESSYNLKAVSKTNDYGIGQVNGIAWPEFNQQLLLTDLSYSINAAAHILSYYKQLKQPDEPISYYCRYNVGPGPLTGSERALYRNRACRAYLEKFRACHTSNPFIGL